MELSKQQKHYEKVAFFDFDYTLAKTTECVKLWSPRGSRVENGERFKFVNPQEYNVLKIADDERIDDSSFSEFDRVDYQNAKKIYPTFVFFEKYLLETSTMPIIISARPQIAESDIFQFLSLNVEKPNIKQLSNVLYIGCKCGKPITKYNHIIKILKESNIKKILFFEDSKKNIEYLEENISSVFSYVDLTTCLIQHSYKTVSLNFRGAL